MMEEWWLVVLPHTWYGFSGCLNGSGILNSWYVL